MFIDSQLGILHEPLSGRRWDGAEAWQRARQRAAVLHQAGVKRGERVFIHYGNKPEFFVDVLALWCLGACAVPVDPRFTAYEVERLARAVAPVCSIWDDAVVPATAAALQGAGVHLLDATSLGDAARAPLAGGAPHLDDAALLLFTSGTTGEPKGVVQTHRALRARWNHQRERLGVAAFARTLCAVPTHFAWGLVGHALYTWLSGQELFLLPAFRPDVLLRLGATCDDLAITCLPSVPSMWRVALRTVAPPGRGTLKRVTLGTAPLPGALWKGVSDWSGGAEVLNVYGISETGWLAGIAFEPAFATGDAPVGEPWGAVIKVLESDATEQGPGLMRECKPGESGHIWVQTPSLMRGYYGRDDLTASVVARGWFCTGDLGALDERGRLYLRGREKELINVGGAKIYPRDIDAALEGLPGVEDVCCFALDDAMLGENVAVALVLDQPGEARLASVYAAAAGRLAAHQLPRRWVVVDQIPRSLRGKLNRAEVAAFCAGRPGHEQRTIERRLRDAA